MPRAKFAALLFIPCACIPGQTLPVRAGGTELVLTAPPGDFVDAGERLRITLFDLLAPSSNRLLAAWAPEKTVAALLQGKDKGGMDVYAMVQTARRAEYLNCTPAAFAEVLSGLEPAMGSLDSEKLGDLDREMNLRLKSAGAKPLEIGRPEMLGGLFKKTDAAGFAMLIEIKQEDRSVKMLNGMGALRLKERLVFAYLYRRYESPDTAQWIRKTLEAWVDSLTAKNR